MNEDSLFGLAKAITAVYAAGLKEGEAIGRNREVFTADKIDEGLLAETLRKDGWTMNATEYILEAVNAYGKRRTHESANNENV